jgi:hypothetical protein
MIKSLHKPISAMIILAFIAMNAFAWDDVGHKITAYIAWQQMTPDVRANVIRTLREAPEDSQLATFFMNYGSRSEETRQREYFMVVATWADIIRDRDFETRYKKYHHSNWHYSDTFWKSTNGNVEVLAPSAEDNGKALEKLNEFTAVVRGTGPDAQKAIAIAWLEHLIGDLHQPLHTSGRVTETEPKGDQGGNLFLLTPKDTPRDKQENLHWFWDSIVIRNLPNSKDECEAEYIDPMARQIMKKFPLSKMQARLNPGNFEEWKSESLRLAQTEVFSPDLKRFEMPSPAYKRRALKIAEERLALAGYRIGQLFNSVFGSPKA